MAKASVSPVDEAERAETLMYSYIDSRQSFIMEAGAGAGKTYSLKKALNYTLNTYGTTLEERGQAVACITFTEAATRELVNEVDNHPLVSVSTIHAFCWSLLRDFQPLLREHVSRMNKWSKYLDEDHRVDEQKVVYDVGFRAIDSEKISLHHDDIPLLMAALLENKKFRILLVSRFPVLYIDEYQDTQSTLMDSIIANLMRYTSIQVGLFGDSWQMIYDEVCGAVVESGFKVIKKHANFRSDKKIVDVLNQIRPNLMQIPEHNNPGQSKVSVYLTNEWSGTRGVGAHKVGSLPDDIAHQYYDRMRERLEGEGWDFGSNKTKILMLTNTILAKEQGYSRLLDQFPYTDQLMNADHRYIKLFTEKVEPVARAFESKAYGVMFTILGRSSKVKNHADKTRWHDYLLELVRLRREGSVGDVVDYIVENRIDKIGLSDGFLKSESLLREYMDDPTIAEGDEDLVKRYRRFVELRAIPYAQVIAFDRYLNEQTPFSTNHKVKGLQYDDVLVVISQSWNKYNFNKLLEWRYEDAAPEANKKFFIHNRNLFYVACSRAKRRLTLLFVREISADALSTLELWFGKDNVSELEL